MSGYLLDTNILINLVNNTAHRLSLRVRDLVATAGVRACVSVVSPWEIAIKSAAGKLQIDEDVADLPWFITEIGCTILPMTIEHVLEVAHPEPATRDPFDRLLLAVCACEGLKLVTTDARLAGHRLVW
ncbi:MAG: type II toxin-antitoxin system VapC family toxin [Novosphingobium sp.]|nr:type II toxin-antitoxin system VapC family toxin [Novosphingobium sp.]